MKDEEKLQKIKQLCLSARLINQTVGKTLDKNPPPGYMPPEKRASIMNIFKEIEKLTN